MEDDRVSETEKALEGAETDDDSPSEESEAEEEVKPQQSMPQKTIEQRLEEVVELLRVDSKNWNNISDADKKYLVERTTHSSGPTALHILADKKPLEKDDFKDLVKYLVKSDRHLLLEVDDNSGYTPLHLAIYRRNRSMIKWICAACDEIDAAQGDKGKGYIDAVLRKKGTLLKRNCIHLAIDSAKTGKDKTARSLVDMASAETLADKDEKGNTPLALAVEYKRCSDGQIKLIEAIVERSDHFIRNHPSLDFNEKYESPYMHHVATIPADRPKVAPAEPVAMVDQRQRRPEQGSRSHMPKANTAASMANAQPSRPDAGGKAGMGPQGKDGPEKVQPPDPGASSRAASDSNERHANEIREFLKKHYLRSRDQDVALEILYGKNPKSEKAISFDLSGYETLTKNEIKQHISILDFENILQYVDVPMISTEQVAQQRSRAQRARISDQQDGDGRSDVQTVFELLREKGVKTILEVTVDDLEHPAHSDLAIEQALCWGNSSQTMNVEIWNWKKIDISPDLICKVASDVTSIQLYWSGRNAVLRAWSEEEGLPKLTKLRHIALHVQQGCLEPHQRVEENIKAFRDRLINHTARARSSEILGELQEEMDKQFNNQSSSKKLREGVKERLAETGKEFRDALEIELAKAIAQVSRAKTETPKDHGRQEKKAAVDKAKQSIKAFVSSEKRKESDDDIYTVLKQAKQRAKMQAKEIALAMASPYFDLDIEVYYPGGSRRTYNHTAQSADGYLERPQKHEWIQCMTEFRQLLYNAEKSFCKTNENRELLKKAVDETDGPITVALIDDGIEVTEIRFDKSIVITGRSFYPKPQERTSDKSTYLPWYLSSKGHSTIMASQIHRVAPKANLCFLKLQDSYHPQSNKRQITIKSAAQAIREATRRKVHIISMSWTITPPSNETESEQQDIKDLEAAIAEASAENILMFCSASDEGANQTATYPSKAQPGKIFKIGGADANGGLYDRVGDISMVDFILPGQLVASDDLTDSALSKQQYWSGSSVATALAAGLAALILYCAQIRVARSRTDAERDTAKKHFKLLRQHGKMKEAFGAITSEGSTGKYPAVWTIFGKKVMDSRNIKNSRQVEPIDLVAGVASSLCYRF
ncbi:hypothetical protein SLS64_003507 [Diaporthe eres]